MFDCFINCLNNGHEDCCEDNPTKGLFSQSDDLALHSKSQLCLKHDNFLNLYYNSNISDSIIFKLWHSKLGMMLDLCIGISAHAHFDYLAARLQWVGIGQKSALNYLDN